MATKTATKIDWISNLSIDKLLVTERVVCLFHLWLPHKPLLICNLIKDEKICFMCNDIDQVRSKKSHKFLYS